MIKIEFFFLGWIGENCLVVQKLCEYGVSFEDKNSLIGYKCFCELGWMGLCCFVDIDECNIIVMCVYNIWCENCQGGYLCICLIGWMGLRCDIDIDECF